LGANKVFFRDLFREVYSSIADLYTYFIQRGHKMLCPNGRFGMITGNRFMRANYGAGLRTFLTQQVKLRKLIDFGDLPVFDDVTAYPVIIISANAQRNDAPIEYALIDKSDFESLATESLTTVIESSPNIMPESSFNGTNWSLAETTENAILEKMKDKSTSVTLAEYTQGTIRRGVLTGFNEAFIIDKATRDRLIAADPKSAEIIKPLLVGQDVRRYATNFQDRYLIWTYVGVPITQYPAIYRHLQQYQPQLEKRSDKGKQWWELRHCDYYAEFERPKIVFPDIAEKCKFAFDSDGNYSINTTYMIPIEENQEYLISLLNSSLIDFFYRAVSNPIRGNYLRFFTQYVNPTPMRCITFRTSPNERARHVAELTIRYQQYLKEGNDQKQ
jgi:restriction endonuclease TaqI-like protein/Eco57I restriction-modification methylase